MKYIFAVFLSIIGFIIILYGDKEVKIKKGKIIQAIDSLSDYGGRFKKFSHYQRMMVKVVFGLVFIFFSIMIVLGKL